MERLTQEQPASVTATPFDELNDLLTRFVARVSSIVGAGLVGVYLTGSFALGGGDAASDCDFLAVTEGGLSREEERALRRLHEEILSWPGYWAHNLEGSYAPKTDLATLVALGQPWLYVNRGSDEMERSSHCNTEDVRWVLFTRPVVLAGIDPRAFVRDVPAALLQTKMQTQIKNFLVDLSTWARFDISWTQRYAVEASTRMLYTLEHGEVISKQEALKWADETLPRQWRDLLEQVRQDRFVRWNSPPRPGSMERSVAFVEYVQERARTATLSGVNGRLDFDVVSVTLRPMTDLEFDAWLPSVRIGYAEDLTTNSGMDPSAARVKADADLAQLFPGGQPSPEQLVFVIEAGGERVGELWLAEREEQLRLSCGCTNFEWASGTVVAASPVRRWSSLSRRPGGEG